MGSARNGVTKETPVLITPEDFSEHLHCLVSGATKRPCDRFDHLNEVFEHLGSAILP
jgi:hypothetical protein